MNLLRYLTRSSDPPLDFDTWVSYFQFNGLNYPFSSAPAQTLGEKQEEIAADFIGYIQGAYKSNGIVFACMLVRLLLFSEARFQFRRMQNGRPGDLFGTADLAPLETPWPGGTTGDLLSRAIQDADLAGNFYGLRDGASIRRLRPDWVTIVSGSKSGDPDPYATDAEILGYIYHPGGRGRADSKPLMRDQVAHFAPVPDPAASFRGMSWLTPVIREVMGDAAATTHKLKYFENGATPNLVVSLDKSIQREAFEKWIELFESEHEGFANAYKTLYLGAGAKAEPIGANLRQVDFKVTQGAGETRIAAAAGVPPVIVGLSEGLQAATYSNYGQARRRFADGTMRPLWRNMAGSLAPIITVPGGAELWYDDRDIAFLQEDRKDAGEIQQLQSQTIRTLVDAGFKPSSVIAAVQAEDFSLLEHTGLFSIQLQPPGTGPPAPNGAGQLSAARRLVAALEAKTRS